MGGSERNADNAQSSKEKMWKRRLGATKAAAGARDDSLAGLKKRWNRAIAACLFGRMASAITKPAPEPFCRTFSLSEISRFD
jgi:hypothetical protein